MFYFQKLCNFKLRPQTHQRKGSGLCETAGQRNNDKLRWYFKFTMASKKFVYRWSYKVWLETPYNNTITTASTPTATTTTTTTATTSTTTNTSTTPTVVLA